MTDPTPVTPPTAASGDEREHLADSDVIIEAFSIVAAELREIDKLKNFGERVDLRAATRRYFVDAVAAEVRRLDAADRAGPTPTLRREVCPIPACGGSGTMVQTFPSIDGGTTTSITVPCPTCRGRGWLLEPIPKKDATDDDAD